MRCENGRFFSPAYGDRWFPSGKVSYIHTATCSEGGSPPCETHLCGFHAFHNLENAKSYALKPQIDGYAITLIEGMGRVIIYPQWFRAQKARVVAVVNFDLSASVTARLAEYGRENTHPTYTNAEQFAAQYFRVPLVDQAELEAEVLQRLFHFVPTLATHPWPPHSERNLPIANLTEETN